MISLLRSNINSLLHKQDIAHSILDFRGRLLIKFSSSLISHDIVSQIAQQISGISSLSIVLVCRGDEEAILKNGVNEATRLFSPNSSFAVRVRREGVHPYSSMEIAAKLGSKILDSDIHGLKVDLTSPQLEIFVDIRGDLAFIYSDIISGIDGIPSTSQGTAIALFRPNTNSVLSAWLMKKRGVKIIPIFFKTGKKAEEEHIGLVEFIFSSVHSFINLEPFFRMFKNEKSLCFYCQLICELISKNYILNGSVQALISPTCFNLNNELMSLDALNALETEVSLSTLRPIQLGYHGIKPSFHAIDDLPCCDHKQRVEILLPAKLNKKKIEEFLKEFQA